MGSNIQSIRPSKHDVQTYGRPPPFCEQIKEAINRELKETIRVIATSLSPTTEASLEQVAVQQLPPPRWTLKRLVSWIQETHGKQCCKETVRKALTRLGFSWKKAKKLLGKANPEKRKEFLESLQPLLDDAMWDKHILVYLDEAHIHQDTDLGYGWSVRGERFWIPSKSPGLSAKVSFYGLYLYNEGQTRIWPYERANGENTVNVLQRLRNEFPNRKIKLIWDGAPYHRSLLVKNEAENLGIELIPLPAYSPDFMPVESLWRWLREDVTYFFCHNTKQELIDRVLAFQDEINQRSCEIADRLWVKDSLDSDVEKLRIPI